MQVWQDIPDFYGYSVSRAGGIRNNKSGRILSQAITERGVYVSLSRGNIQYNRMVSRLVAEAFLELPELPHHRATFTTPINLDGDRSNNCIDNLLWRPRWFAVKYHQQFRRYWVEDYLILNRDTGELFDSLLEAAKAYGILVVDILIDMTSQVSNGVWPIGHHFEIPYNNTRNNRRL